MNGQEPKTPGQDHEGVLPHDLTETSDGTVHVPSWMGRVGGGIMIEVIDKRHVRDDVEDEEKHDGQEQTEVHSHTWHQETTKGNEQANHDLAVIFYHERARVNQVYMMQNK